MDARDASRYQAFRRAMQCIVRHPELGAAVARGSTWPSFQNVIASIPELEVRQSYATQRGKELTAVDERLREAACALIRQVALLAEDMEPDVRGRRVFPRPDSEASSAEVIVAARTSAELARPRAADFVYMGMSPTFLTDLEDAARALEQNAAERADNAASGKGATAAIEARIQRGGELLGILDSLVRKELTAETLAEWKQAIRLGRTHRPRRAAAPPPEPATPAAPEAQESVSVPEPTPDGTAIDELPAPAPLKALPPAGFLDALIGLFLRHADRRDPPKARPDPRTEPRSADLPDATVNEIRRLPPPRTE